MDLYTCAVSEVMPEHHRLGQHPHIAACHWVLLKPSGTEALISRDWEGGSSENGLKDKPDIGKANERGKKRTLV